MLLPRQCFMYAAHDQNHRTLICVAAMIVCQSTYVHLHVWMEDFFTCCNGWEWVYVELTLSHISAAVTGNTLMDSRTSNVVLMKTKAHTHSAINVWRSQSFSSPLFFHFLCSPPSSSTYLWLIDVCESMLSSWLDWLSLKWPAVLTEVDELLLENLTFSFRRYYYDYFPPLESGFAILS